MKKVISDLKNKNKEEILKDIRQVEGEIAKMILEVKSNPPKDTNTVSKKKKRLAVLKTIVRELK